MLSGLYRVVPLGPDRVQVCNAGRSVVLHGVGLVERITPLLDALDGHNTTAQLVARFPDLAPQLLDGLARKGMLMDGETGLGRSAPAALTAAALGSLSGAVVAKAMQNATVIVVGCGPVGTTVALHLAKAGVARLLVADDGEIAAAEIAVSPLLGPSAVGRLRSEVVRELCRSAGAIGVDTVPSPVPTDLVVTADLLVIEGRDASGIPLADEADAALSAGVPFLIHSQDALEAFVGPHVRSDGDPCHRCAETRRLGHVDNLDEFMEYRRLRAEQSPLSDCFLSAHASLMAGLISTEILRILVGAPHLSDRSVAVVDLATLNIERSEVLAVPGCPACATAAGTTEQIEIPDPPVAAGSPGVGS